MGFVYLRRLKLRQVNERQARRVKKIYIPASVEVLELPLRMACGSKALVNATGCSWRKYSSGVWKVIPTLEAKSLRILSTHK